MTRLVLVLPSTGAFDSRAHRIATSAVQHGYAVTVLARAGAGLPAVERATGGYEIRRVEVSAVDGLPLPARARGWLDRARRRRRGAPVSSSTGSAGSGSASDRPAGSSAQRAGRGGPIGRAFAGLRRLLAISLTVASQVRQSRSIDPGGDLYHGSGYMGIPVAHALARRSGGRVIYDARDIYVDAGNIARMPGPFRRLVGRVERGWARRADAVVTVNRPYAEVMAARWGIDLPTIVLNCPAAYRPPTPRPRRFHERLGLDAATRVVLYHGGFTRDRGIEQLVEACRDLPRTVLVLLGYGALFDELSRRADGLLHVLPAVPPADLLDFVASADVAAMPIQPTTLNHRLTTPNKLFEAMAAGVPVVASDLPGMASIVRETGCGVLCDPTRPSAIREAILGILDAPEADRIDIRERALAAAARNYNWAAQVGRLLETYDRALGTRR